MASVWQETVELNTLFRIANVLKNPVLAVSHIVQPDRINACIGITVLQYKPLLYRYIMHIEEYVKYRHDVWYVYYPWPSTTGTHCHMSYRQTYPWCAAIRYGQVTEDKSSTSYPYGCSITVSCLRLATVCSLVGFLTFSMEIRSCGDFGISTDAHISSVPNRFQHSLHVKSSTQ